MFANIHPGLVTVAMHHIVNNDAPHRTGHIMDVAHNSIYIADLLGLDHEPMLLASLLHDIYSLRGRKTHNRLAAAWVRQNLGNYGYSSGMVDDVATMCAEHRDSGAGIYSSQLSEAFAAADRGPLVLIPSIERSLGGQLDTFTPEVLRTSVPLTLDMLRSKFGHSGYACLNKVHEEIYAESNAVIRDQLELSNSQLVDIVLAALADYTPSPVVVDIFAYKNKYVINNGAIALYVPSLELFIDSNGAVICAHEVTSVQGALQLNGMYYQR